MFIHMSVNCRRYVETALLMNNNNWHHFVMTWDRVTGGIYNISIDGVIQYKSAKTSGAIRPGMEIIIIIITNDTAGDFS